MNLIIKNTTVSDIEVDSVGVAIPASGQLTIDRSNLNLWAAQDTITEITTAINAGDIVINDGTSDLAAPEGLKFLEGFTAERADDSFTINDYTTDASDVRLRTKGTFNGFTIDKPNSISGFMSYMPNSETPQIIAGDPNAANGINVWNLDVDMEGEMRLNVLPGAGANGDVRATCNAALKPDIDLTSQFGTDDLRWEKIKATGIRHKINQTAHTFTLPSYGLIPVYYNNVTSAYERANANDINTAADAVVVEVIDADNFEIQEGGFLFGAHGLNVGEWYALRSGLAGLILPADQLDGMNKQYLCFAVDANTILLRVDPIFEHTSFIPQDIEVANEWSQGGNPTTTATGDDLLLLVGVTWEDSSGSTLISSIEIGGQTGTLVAEQSVISGLQNGSGVYYWTEAQLTSMTNSILTINWTAGAPKFHQTYDAIIRHVDQVSPIVATNTDSGNGATDTLDADVAVAAGGYVVAVSSGGNVGMTFTNNGTGWTRKLDLTITSADGVVDDKLIATTSPSENVNMGITGSNRHVLVAGSFRRREL